MADDAGYVLGTLLLDVAWVCAGVALYGFEAITPERVLSVSLADPRTPLGAWMLVGVVLGAMTALSVDERVTGES